LFEGRIRGLKMSSTEQTLGLLVVPDTKESRPIGIAIAKALRKSGIGIIHVDDSIESAELWNESIHLAIERADFIVADITDKNPNVMYEVGFAHALRKPVIPIVKRGTGHVPNVIAGYIYLVYDPSNLDKLSEDIQTWAFRNQPKWKQEEALK
jgi:predicted methyltransferase